jgi:hypothetical protein
MANLHNTPIRIANILIELTSPLSAVELGIEGRLGPFRAAGTPGKPLARVALRWEESAHPPTPHGELIYDAGLKMYRAGTDCYAALTYQSGGRGARARAVLRANPGWDDLTLTERRTGPQWWSLLNIGVGELILRTAILFTGGLVFHSAAIDDNGRGIVIVGHSGEGKSTQANFWNHVPGALVINEDRNAVRSSTSVTMCYGTPWAGKSNIARNHEAPLSALILLEHAPKNDIQRLSPSVSAPLLLARAFLPYWDQSLMLRAMANLNGILARVPVYRLRCRPEPEVVSLVRSVL